VRVHYLSTEFKICRIYLRRSRWLEDRRPLSGRQRRCGSLEISFMHSTIAIDDRYWSSHA